MSRETSGTDALLYLFALYINYMRCVLRNQEENEFLNVSPTKLELTVEQIEIKDVRIWSFIANNVYSGHSFSFLPLRG